LSAPSEERVEFLGLGIGQRPHRWAHAIREQREPVGIDAIRLGELPGRLRKVTDLP